MTAGRAAGAVAGGRAAGLGLSAVMLVGERLSGQPSELIELEREAAVKLGIGSGHGDEPASEIEQLVTHGGHLARSALVGLPYAAVVDDDADGTRAGVAFGSAFFVAAYEIIGPALDVTPLPWRQPPLRAVQHPLVHILFGVVMARFARRDTSLTRR